MSETNVKKFLIADTKPKLPKREQVCTRKQARDWLDFNIQGFGAWTTVEQDATVKTLLSLIRDKDGQLRTRRLNVPLGQDLTLICLFPGENKLEQTRSFLTSTVQGFAELSFKAQWEHTLAYLRVSYVK